MVERLTTTVDLGHPWVSLLPALAASGAASGSKVRFSATRVVTKRRTTGTSPVARDCYRDTRLRTSIAAKWRCTTRQRRRPCELPDARSQTASSCRGGHGSLALKHEADTADQTTLTPPLQKTLRSSDRPMVRHNLRKSQRLNFSPAAQVTTSNRPIGTVYDRAF